MEHNVGHCTAKHWLWDIVSRDSAGVLKFTTGQGAAGRKRTGLGSSNMAKEERAVFF